MLKTSIYVSFELGAIYKNYDCFKQAGFRNNETDRVHFS